MPFSKTLRYLIVVNGILIPIFVLALLFQLVKSWFDKEPEYAHEEPESIIVGEKLDQSSQKGLALQGLTYENPRDIYNSKNQYLPLSALTYEEAKKVKEVASAAGDVSLSFYNVFNILFLDKDYRVIGRLVNRKASISDLEIPSGDYRNGSVDTTVQHIAYYIGFVDTNKDGLLDSKDQHDLHISDLSGKNLTQVTQHVDVESYYFQRSHSEIFITYKERTNQREEHKQKKFAIYHIREKRLEKLTNIEKALAEIEKQLVQ